VPYRLGESIFDQQQAAGNDQRTKEPQAPPAASSESAKPAEPAAERAVQPPPAGAGPAPDATGAGASDTAAPAPSSARDRGGNVEAVLGQEPYRPGRLWSFPRIEPGIGVDELNDILRRAKKAQEDVTRERAALEQRRAELDAREQDIADRQQLVLSKMTEVEQMRARLQAEVDDFRNTVLLIRDDESAGLKALATTLQGIEPSKAASVIIKWWETEEGQTKALKVWTVMDPDAANAILGEMDVELVRQVLDKRLKVVREPAKPKG
jgi:flagellar motility protein MotE (MotC chaperone)